jgi:hypothetical protein
MPRTQVANIGTYGFGAGVTENAPLTFSVRRGGRLTVRAENQNEPNTTALAVTLQVSADGTTWADTTAAANTTAVADVSIPARQYREWQISLRQGQDNFFRLQAVGGGRGELQIRGDEILQIKTV